MNLIRLKSRIFAPQKLCFALLIITVLSKYHVTYIFRIDKDVQRCDRNLSYFTDGNLEKLRNVITTYVWENLDIGYMQVREMY